jgi:hypothetical protein
MTTEPLSYTELLSIKYLLLGWLKVTITPEVPQPIYDKREGAPPPMTDLIDHLNNLIAEYEVSES